MRSGLPSLPLGPREPDLDRGSPEPPGAVAQLQPGDLAEEVDLHQVGRQLVRATVVQSPPSTRQSKRDRTNSKPIRSQISNTGPATWNE